MKIINQFQHNIRRIALAGAMATIIVTSLVGCGDTPTTSTSEPTATTAASSDVSTTASDTPADASSSAGMEAPTQPAGVNNLATPAESLAQTDPASSGQAGASGSAAGTEIKAALKEWAIDLSQKEVPAGKITFTVTNEGMMRHNLTVLDSSGSQLAQTSTFAASEGAQTLALDLQPGTYQIICSLPGHAQRGQKTELVVK